MKTALIILGVLIAIGAAIAAFAASSYNGLVRKEQSVNAQWAQVQNVYQRRADLIPNLVNTVAGAANFERSTLTQITAARASVGQVKIDPNKAPTDPAQLAQFERAQGELGSALSRLLVVSERYPDLKATGNFQTLQAQLEGTENRIAVERGRFNEVVLDYNATLRQFPTVIFAGMLGFQPHAYFNAAPGADKAPQVQFDFNQKS